MSLMETMRSTLVIPSQCSTSGMSAWKRMSFTPAMSSVDLKYLSAESPPRLRRLYTRYLGVGGQDSGGLGRAGDVLGDLAERAAFFPEVDDDADAACGGVSRGGEGRAGTTCRSGRRVCTLRWRR